MTSSVLLTNFKFKSALADMSSVKALPSSERSSQKRKKRPSKHRAHARKSAKCHEALNKTLSSVLYDSSSSDRKSESVYDGDYCVLDHIAEDGLKPATIEVKKVKTSHKDLPLPIYLKLLSSSGARGGRSRSRTAPAGSRPRSRRRAFADFTYVSSTVKYSMFFFNVLFWLMGFLLIGIGLYAVVDKWSSGESFKLDNVFDVIFNVALFMVLVGGVVFLVSFAGCIGALRENMCFLKLYSICLLAFFLAEMALTAVGFIFPDKVSYFMEKSLTDELIKSYRDDLDFQNLIDQLQQKFECCGISSEGYLDWSKNEYFNCTKNPADNPSVERCGVPYSCCLPGEATSFSDDPDLVNIMCGFGVQEMKKVDLITKIYTRGCIPSLKSYVEQNMTLIAGIALGVALVQLLALWLSRTLEGQIENQRARWHYN